MAKAKKDSVSQKNNDDRDLFIQAATGDMAAREQIILNHIPLVNQCVGMYVGKGVPNEDLFQEGCYGLILALDRFDPSRNTRFSSFARPYILKYIRKAVVEQNGLQPAIVAEDLFYKINKFIEIKNSFYVEHQRQPTVAELAELMQVKESKIREMETVVFSFFSPSISLDSLPGSSIFVDSVCSHPVEAELFQLEPSDICALTKREKEVLRRRLGYTSSGSPETWPEICAATGLALMTVFNSYNSGIKKMRDAINKAT